MLRPRRSSDALGPLATLIGGLALAAAACGGGRNGGPTDGGGGSRDATAHDDRGDVRGDARNDDRNDARNDDRGDARADGACAPQIITLANPPPDVVILLDRSASMSNDLDDQPCAGGCGALSKWAAVGPGIDPILAATAGRVHWGLAIFPDVLPDAGACDVGLGLTVTPGSSSAAKIADAIAVAAPSGGTPTRAALAAAGAALSDLPERASGTPAFVVLVTDGVPNCASGATGPDASDILGALQATTNLSASGIATFVVGVATAESSGSSADAALTLLSVAGGRPTDDAPYYRSIIDAASLTAALSEIASSIVSCNFQLAAPLDDPSPAAVHATTGAAIPGDAANGWTYDAATTSIILNGDSCAAVRSGAITGLQLTAAPRDGC